MSHKQPPVLYRVRADEWANAEDYLKELFAAMDKVIRGDTLIINELYFELVDQIAMVLKDIQMVMAIK